MTPLHKFGDSVCDLFLAIPLPAVRGLFLLTLGLLLIWVLLLPSTATTPPGGARRWHEDLKFGAALAIIIQILIYALL